MKPLRILTALVIGCIVFPGLRTGAAALETQTARPVTPGSHQVLPHAFQAPPPPPDPAGEVRAFWRLYVPTPPKFRHRAGSHWPTHNGWVAHFPEACGATGLFHCIVEDENISELNFQYTFRGVVVPCEPDGSGPIPPWQVEGKTARQYFVLPACAVACVGRPVTLRAEDEAGQPVLSRWTVEPKANVSPLPADWPAGATITFSADAPNQFIVTGVSLDDERLTDMATVLFYTVRIAEQSQTGGRIEVGETARYAAVVQPPSVTGDFEWQVNHPATLEFVGGNVGPAVTVAGREVSAAPDAEELSVTFTPISGPACTVATRLTVVASQSSRLRVWLNPIAPRVWGRDVTLHAQTAPGHLTDAVQIQVRRVGSPDWTDVGPRFTVPAASFKTPWDTTGLVSGDRYEIRALAWDTDGVMVVSEEAGVTLDRDTL